MRAFLGGLCVAFCLFVTVASAQVTGRVDSIGFGGDYRPGCWTPMRVLLQTNGAPTGFYELRVWQHDLDGDLPYFSTRVSLTSGAGEQPFWTYFIPEPVRGGLTNDASTPAELTARLRITVHDAAGKELAQVPLAGKLTRSVEPSAGPYDRVRAMRLALLVGTAASPALAHYDPARLVGVKEDLTAPKLTAEQLPENALGYDGVDAVVWLAGDPAQLSASGGRRFDALRDWVRTGGHLVISTPANYQQLNGFDELLPVDISGVETNALQSPIRELAGEVPFPRGAPGVPRQNPWDAYDAPQTLATATPRAGAVVELYADRVADAERPEDRTPWLVRQSYGFGCVTWVAQDLGDRELLDRANWGWPAVWERVLNAEGTPIVAPRPIDDTRFRAGGQRNLGFAVLDAMNLEGRGATLVGVTIAFFVAYWVLVGPTAFFWLRYKGRATLNWFVFGGLALVATAVTLGLVRLVLRGDAEVKHVSLVRVDGDRTRPAMVVSRLGMYVPRDGAQRIEIAPGGGGGSGASGAAATPGTLPPTLTPFPIHPVLHARRDGDKFLFAAPRAYRVGVPSDEASGEPARADVPFRTTMKRLQAEWHGPIEPRVEGSARLVPSVGSVGFIAGTLRNLTGRDLQNVYVAFRHQPPGGVPRDWMMYVAAWRAGEPLDLGKAFNPPADKGVADITINPDRNVRPNGVQPVRGWLSQWAELFAPALRANAIGDTALSDLGSSVPVSVPVLSLFDRFPPLENERGGDPNAPAAPTRADLHRSGLRDWDVSNALSAGRLIVLAQADDTPIPVPLSVEGSAVEGRGLTIYQFILPLAPIPEEPATRPATRPTTAPTTAPATSSQRARVQSAP